MTNEVQPYRGYVDATGAVAGQFSSEEEAIEVFDREVAGEEVEVTVNGMPVHLVFDDEVEVEVIPDG